MNTYRLKNVLLPLLTASALLGGAVTAQSATLEEVLDVSEAKNEAARQSQAKIDRLAEETRDLLEDYKAVNKQMSDMKAKFKFGNKKQTMDTMPVPSQ